MPVRIVLTHGMTTTNNHDCARPGDTARSIIAKRWPDLAQHLATVETFAALELDTSGPVETLKANGIRLASAWQPDAESLLQIEHLNACNHAITLYGVGMGSLPKLMLQRLSPKGTLTIVLMNTTLFNTMLDVIEQSQWLQHSAIRLELASEQTCVATCRVITTPLLKLAEPSAERLRDHLLQAITAGRSRQFQKSREAMIQANIDANEATIATDRDVATLFADYCDTAVVVGAGPTLDFFAGQYQNAPGARCTSSLCRCCLAATKGGRHKTRLRRHARSIAGGDTFFRDQSRNSRTDLPRLLSKRRSKSCAVLAP